MIAISQVLAAPAIVGVLLAPTPTISYCMLFLAYVTAETWLGPAAAIVQVKSSYLCMHTRHQSMVALYIGLARTTKWRRPERKGLYNLH